VEWGKYLKNVACCIAKGMYIPPIVILKGVRKHAVFEGNFLPGSAVVARVVGYVNDVLFFNGFSTFKKYKATGKCYSFWTNMEAIRVWTLYSIARRMKYRLD
jgi:hypothetical protein